MVLWQNYLRPTSINDALKGLAEAPGPALPIAGGTDLLLDLKQGHHPPVHTLVDLTTIPEMNVVEIRADKLFIGAAVPLSRLVSAELIQEHARGLVEAAGLVGGPQVRNTASLGGNVAHALPAADGTISLMVLQVQAEVASLKDRRLVPVETLFVGPGKSSLESEKELLVGFYLPLRKPHQASAFRRVMRDQGIALPILNVAVWVERNGERVKDVRIAVGPGGPTPWRATRAEDSLREQVYSPKAFSTALDILRNQAVFRTSAYRATSEYRTELIGTLLEECFTTAWERAGMD